MQARMKHPVFLVPEAMKALQALNTAIGRDSVPARTHELIHLRVSQINGCSVCCDMHARSARKSGETDERLFCVAAWREAPYFSDAERAALALAEALTRIADRPEAVSDEIWAEAAKHYDEKGLAALILTISQINVWNRLNAAIKQPAGGKWD